MNLSEREKEVLKRLCLPNKIIAKSLNISVSTTKTHVHNISNKFFWVKGRCQILIEGLKQKIINIEEVITH